MAKFLPLSPRAAWQPGFTLIELLIVVTIIAILASIAVPNFLEAQIRSKVARVKADMRSLATAVESYNVENNKYPIRRNTLAIPPNFTPPTAQATLRAQQMSRLTTPIGYITSFPLDPFEKGMPPPNNIIDYYDLMQSSWLLNATHPRTLQPERRVQDEGAGWMMISVGPDGYLGAVDNSCACPLGPANSNALRGTIYYVYDPTNGTVSTGNIYNSSFYGMENGPALTRHFYGGQLP